MAPGGEHARGSKYTKPEIAQATATWLVAHPDQAVSVADDQNVSWAVPRAAYDAIIMKAAVQDARAAIEGRR